MSRFYPDKPDSHPETAWNFLMDRKVRTIANKKSASSRRAAKAIQRIEAMLNKEKGVKLS